METRCPSLGTGAAAKWAVFSEEALLCVLFNPAWLLSSTALRQVEIVRTYTAKQADELSLQVADVVLVYQKVSDGE